MWKLELISIMIEALVAFFILEPVASRSGDRTRCGNLLRLGCIRLLVQTPLGTVGRSVFSPLADQNFRPASSLDAIDTVYDRYLDPMDGIN